MGLFFRNAEKLSPSKDGYWVTGNVHGPADAHSYQQKAAFQFFTRTVKGLRFSLFGS